MAGRVAVTVTGSILEPLALTLKGFQVVTLTCVYPHDVGNGWLRGAPERWRGKPEGARGSPRVQCGEPEGTCGRLGVCVKATCADLTTYKVGRNPPGGPPSSGSGRGECPGLRPQWLSSFLCWEALFGLGSLISSPFVIVSIDNEMFTPVVLPRS